MSTFWGSLYNPLYPPDCMQNGHIKRLRKGGWLPRPAVKSEREELSARWGGVLPDQTEATPVPME